tara:strand:+ start:779 stop:1105 length:327 start_codon:yes stop_codon:yes gene_type:complete
MNKVTPITYKAKNGSPFKISQGLVDGAENLYGSMNKVKGKEKEKETKPSPGNNQQPSNPPPPDLTETGSKDKGKENIDPVVKSTIEKERKKMALMDSLEKSLGKVTIG